MEVKIDRKIKTKLTKKYACYILITCDSPSFDGTMNVEMTFEGDPLHVSYLLQEAQKHLEDQEKNETRS